MVEAFHDTTNSKPSLGIRAARVAFAAGVVLVSTTGCSTEINAQTEAVVTKCSGYPGARYYLGARSSDTPVDSVSDLEANVRDKMAVLYDRVTAVGGSSTFSDGAASIFEKSVGDAYSVSTNSDTMTITFPYTDNGFNTTEVEINITDGQPEPLTPGAIVCMYGSAIFPNGLVGIVDNMYEKTQGLDALQR